MKKEEEFCNVRFVGELEAGLVNKLDAQEDEHLLFANAKILDIRREDKNS